MAEPSALIAAYVTQMQRAYAQNTRGIATPEMRSQWRREAVEVLDRVHAEGERAAAERIAEAIAADAEPYMFREIGAANEPYRNGIAQGLRRALLIARGEAERHG